MDKTGSFTIQQMTHPKGSWIWSLLDANGEHLGLSRGGHSSSDAAAKSICALLKTLGSDTSKIDIWIETKVRKKWNCQK